ncbi:MAG: hypothetical protein RLZ28_1216 [Actinomycetota bacterium]|jgi:peptide deformylase
MTIRSIHIKGSPVLHARASEVEVFDRSLKKLVNDMYETMDEAPGVGLAAPQVGVALRVFVYDYEDAEGNPVRGEVINPKLELGKLSLEPASEDTDSEGCLSFPGERFPTRRADWVKVTGVNLRQEPIEVEATGWLARIFQHEFDHLEGTLYVDKLESRYLPEVDEITERRGWGKPGKTWIPGLDNLED